MVIYLTNKAIFKESLLPSKVDNITDKNKSSQRSNLLSDDKSLADEDLEDSLLGGLLESKNH